ncbi:MAG: hypothetical protein A2Y62_08745 [Candidatus Fischerbacteria bacterium RBG_13_37_8]|uniref:Uncharacterized protein n=1 Tax=Candidatus Fischerbacteria bacterium RBG_13_37_8 TaxID=1817863 RepID=A0A1F5V8E4_9BACT|nr:MAG: hypothetical protein A2Y62_08745 [Candidatus Fischerbacteria bacterium RBG_13_37_8]
MSRKKRIIVFAFLLLFLLILLALGLARFYVDGHLWLIISGKISHNNAGIPEVNIYFTDVNLMPNEIKIENKLIGKSGEDGKLSVKYGYPFSFTGYLFLEPLYYRKPLPRGDFIIILEKNNYEMKKLRFKVLDLKKNGNEIYLEINQKMHKVMK